LLNSITLYSNLYRCEEQLSSYYRMGQQQAAWIDFLGTASGKWSATETATT